MTEKSRNGKFNGDRMVLGETDIMKNIQNQDINNPKGIFGTSLFWDTEEIDLIKNADFIIARVLDFGDQTNQRL
jgi:hypothetical protein